MGGGMSEVRWRPAVSGQGAEGDANTVATEDIREGNVVWQSTSEHVSVLYSAACRSHCNRCYRRLASAQSGRADDRKPRKPYQCMRCGSFSLCGSCIARCGNALLRWHMLECAPYCQIPEHLRQGDTDYLRFILRWFAMLRHGNPPEGVMGSGVISCSAQISHVLQGVRTKKSEASDGEGAEKQVASAFQLLATNRDLLKPSFVEWCDGFASYFAKHVELPPGCSVREVSDMLCRIRTNGLGFPFNESDSNSSEPLGWTMDLRASFINHSCDPNCQIAMGSDGSLCVRSLRRISRGEELSISYAEGKTRTREERRAHLYDLYRFHCCCALCERGQ